MERTFSIEIDICETLTIGEIWPDGNAPENPTVDDVYALLLKDYDVHRTCRDWGLEIRKENVRVTSHEPKQLERLPRAQQRPSQKPEGAGD